MFPWLGLSSTLSFEVGSIVRGCGSIWGKVGITMDSNRESIGAHTSTVSIVSVQLLLTPELMYRENGGISVSLFVVSLRLFCVLGPVVLVYLYGGVHENHFCLWWIISSCTINDWYWR